jgi:hypothetical protein
MNTFRTSSSLRRAAGVVLLGAVVLGGSFATAAAFSGRGSSGGEDPASPAPSRAPVISPSPAPVVMPGPVVTPPPVVAGPVVEPEPVATPEPKPVATPEPEPVATPGPTDGGDDAIPLTVDLETADGHDVYVDIVDRYGLLESAESGHPAEGMSVEPYTLQIENLDERTLKLTWIDFGIDNALELHFFQDGRIFVMVQPDPDGDVDAMGFDRELILTFEEPISADDIDGFLQGGLDTPGDDAA